MSRDVRRRACRGVGRVVDRIGAADGNAADAHALGRAHVLVREGRRGVAGGQGIATETVVGECHCPSGRPVIDFVHAGDADQQRPGGDVRRRRGAGRGQLVVARGRAAQAQTRRRDGLAVAGVLVGERSRAADQVDVIAANHAAKGAACDRRGRCAVVSLVAGGDTGRQRGRRDVRGRGRLCQ